MFWKKTVVFNNLEKISKILTGEETSMEGLPENLNGNDLTHFKYASITNWTLKEAFRATKMYYKTTVVRFI